MCVGMLHLQLMFERSSWWDFIRSVAPDLARKHNPTAAPWSSDSYNLPSPAMFPEPPMLECFVDVPHWDWPPQLFILIGCSFLHMLRIMKFKEL